MRSYRTPAAALAGRELRSIVRAVAFLARRTASSIRAVATPLPRADSSFTTSSIRARTPVGIGKVTSVSVPTRSPSTRAISTVLAGVATIAERAAASSGLAEEDSWGMSRPKASTTSLVTSLSTSTSTFTAAIYLVGGLRRPAGQRNAAVRWSSCCLMTGWAGFIGWLLLEAAKTSDLGGQMWGRLVKLITGCGAVALSGGCLSGGPAAGASPAGSPPPMRGQRQQAVRRPRGAAPIHARDLDLDGEPQQQHDHRRQGSFVHQLAGQEMRAGHRLSQRHPSEPAELRGGDLRSRVLGDSPVRFRMQSREGLRHRRAQHLRAGRDVACIRGLDAVELRQIGPRRVRGAAQSAGLLHQAARVREVRCSV